MDEPEKPTPREILAANVRRLKLAHPDLGGPKKIADASAQEPGKKLSNGTMGRIAAGTSATSVDMLAPLAKVFGIEPWQLLVEGLDPKKLPALTTTPMLEQIRRLLTSEEVRTGNEFADVSDVTDRNRKPSGRSSPDQPALDHATRFQVGEGNNIHVSRPAAPASKQRARRKP